MTDTNTTNKGIAVLSMAEIVAKSPDPVAAIRALGTSIAKSQMMGPTDRVEVGEVLVMYCITTGITLAELFRTHQLSFGRLEKRIDAAVAEFRTRGGKIEWLDDGSGGQQARARFSIGDESLEASCSVDEAKKAGWMKNGKWTSEPTTMLRARVKKRGIVALCPDIFFGVADETEDRDMTPLPVDGEKMAAAAAATRQALPRQTAPTLAAAPAPAPAAAPAQATPAPTPAPEPAPTASTVLLSEELQGKLVEIIGADKIPAAQAWAVSVNWLAPGAALEELSEKNAKAIIANPQRFTSKLDAFIEKNGGAK